MMLSTLSSPHTHPLKNTGQVMRQVCYALCPALLALTWTFGLGSLVNAIWCVLLAVALESACLKLRNKPIAFYLQDGSAVLTGLLLGLSITPLAPWWLGVIGLVFAIPIAKHLYGGLGQNPFNPAMIGYALLLISFPVEMTRWPTHFIAPEHIWQSFTGSSLAIDKLTGATPLDFFKTSAQQHLIKHNTWLGDYLDNKWLMINIAFALGGLYLLVRKIITWHIPVAFLGGLAMLSTVFFMFDATQYASPLVHVLTGASMMGAFFIATDPVTAPSANQGRLLYGAMIGALIYIIRTWGGYPDAVAFAVLLMNLAAPLIDTLVKPRTFGHDIKPITWRGKK
jgi:electron transport complex protein RnfD